VELQHRGASAGLANKNSIQQIATRFRRGQICGVFNRQNPSWIPLARSAASTCGVMLTNARRVDVSGGSVQRFIRANPWNPWLKTGMYCRPNCGACCIAPSISSPIPGMPHGKPAGIPCVQLLPDFRCALFGSPERPAVCVSLRPAEEMCGTSREYALAYLRGLEQETRE
jgi:hypothetical protein